MIVRDCIILNFFNVWVYSLIVQESQFLRISVVLKSEMCCMNVGEGCMNVGEGLFVSGLYLIPSICDGNAEYVRKGEDMWFWRCALMCSWWYGNEISLACGSRHEIDSRSNDESIHSCAWLTFYRVCFIRSIHKLVVLFKYREFTEWKSVKLPPDPNLISTVLPPYSWQHSTIPYCTIRIFLYPFFFSEIVSVYHTFISLGERERERER